MPRAINNGLFRRASDNGRGPPRGSDNNRAPRGADNGRPLVASMRMRMDDYLPPKQRRTDGEMGAS